MLGQIFYFFVFFFARLFTTEIDSSTRIKMWRFESDTSHLYMPADPLQIALCSVLCSDVAAGWQDSTDNSKNTDFGTRMYNYSFYNHCKSLGAT